MHDHNAHQQHTCAEVEAVSHHSVVRCEHWHIVDGGRVGEHLHEEHTNSLGAFDRVIPC
jgi:hypothetical protein